MSLEASKHCESSLALCRFCPIKTLNGTLQVIGKEAVDWALENTDSVDQFDYVTGRLQGEFGARQGGWTEVVRDCYVLEVDRQALHEA